jgi:hypothetical protein
MKKTTWDTMRRSLILVGIFSLCLAIAPMVALAFSESEDNDQDGFHNDDEDSGITIITSTGSKTYETDKNKKTIFVAIVDNSNLLEEVESDLGQDVDWLAYLKNGGLGYEVVELSGDEVDAQRNLKATLTPGTVQKAARVIINANPDSPIAGQANQGENLVDGLDEATVYVARIRNYVEKIYTDNDLPINDSIIIKYIQHTIAHEIGHTIGCRTQYSSSYGYHYAPKTKVIMDQYIWYKVKKDKVTKEPIKVVWKIGTQFSQESIEGARLASTSQP